MSCGRDPCAERGSGRVQKAHATNRVLARSRIGPPQHGAPPSKERSHARLLVDPPRHAVLTRELAAVVAHERTATAAVLAHLAEFDARRLYLPAGYPSMVAYCLHELRLSEDGAYKRIHAARAARKFPALFSAVAEGRLHLTGAGLLVPHLTAENADALLAAATPDQGRDRALAGAALPALGAAGAGAAPPTPRPAASRGTCAGASRG